MVYWPFEEFAAFSWILVVLNRFVVCSESKLPIEEWRRNLFVVVIWALWQTFWESTLVDQNLLVKTRRESGSFIKTLYPDSGFQACLLKMTESLVILILIGANDHIRKIDLFLVVQDAAWRLAPWQIKKRSTKFKISEKIIRFDDKQWVSMSTIRWIVYALHIMQTEKLSFKIAVYNFRQF